MPSIGENVHIIDRSDLRFGKIGQITNKVTSKIFEVRIDDDFDFYHVTQFCIVTPVYLIQLRLNKDKQE